MCVIILQATDFAEPQLNSTADVSIEVIDMSDEPARFRTDPYLAHIQESLDPGQKVCLYFTDFYANSGI
ncbi:hypothetical protein TNCV_2521091 [Trichonephila clavipes]|nr:hypothetical protein TNCV_2521091 [Trichonephila clavipes]